MIVRSESVTTLAISRMTRRATFSPVVSRSTQTRFARSRAKDGQPLSEGRPYTDGRAVHKETARSHLSAFLGIA